MSTGSRRWWRSVAVALAGGAAVGGVWFGPARAEPPAPWVRSPSPLGAVPLPDKKPPEPKPETPAVVPAVAVTKPGAASGVVPAVALTPPEPEFRPLTVVQVQGVAPADGKGALPRTVLPTGAVQTEEPPPAPAPSKLAPPPTPARTPVEKLAEPTPPAPALPVLPAPALPALPTTPPVSSTPAAPSAPLQVPALPALPTPPAPAAEKPPEPKPAPASPVAQPKPSAPPITTDPVKPAPAAPTSASPIAPVAPAPVPPAPALPAPVAPALPPVLTPPALPANSAPPAKPVSPPGPDFRLRPGDGGNSVKTGGPIEIGTRKPSPVPLAAEQPKPAPPVAAAPLAPVAVVPAAPPVAPVVTVPVAPGAAAPAAPPVAVTPPDPAPIAPVVPEKPAPVAANTAERPAVEIPAVPTAATRPRPAEPVSRETTPGGSAMNLKQTTAAAVIGGAIAFAPAKPAAAFPLPPLATSPVAADPLPKATDDRLKDIERDLKRLIELLDGRRDEKGITLPSDPGLVAEMKRLKDDIDRLSRQIDDMKKSTSLRPSTATPADPTAGKGVVLVMNEYPVEITIVVNGQSYRVAANAELKINIPAGSFSYQLLSAGANLAPVTSTIKERETVKLRIK